MKSIQGLITGVAIVALAVIGAPVASAAPVTGAGAANKLYLNNSGKTWLKHRKLEILKQLKVLSRLTH